MYLVDLILAKNIDDFHAVVNSLYNQGKMPTFDESELDFRAVFNEPSCIYVFHEDYSTDNPNYRKGCWEGWDTLTDISSDLARNGVRKISDICFDPSICTCMSVAQFFSVPLSSISKDALVEFL